MNQSRALVEHLMASGVLKTQSIINAFSNVDRKDFVHKAQRANAYEDHPLTIGNGQTISQPYTVAFMLELLEPKKENVVLDVGYGSGWTSALLAHIIGPSGRVHAIERISELCAFGEKNIKKYPELAKRVTMFCQSALADIPDVQFDRIISGASGREIPELWKKHLKIGGRIIAPVGYALVLLIKTGKSQYKTYDYPHFAFVPLVEE